MNEIDVLELETKDKAKKLDDMDLIKTVITEPCFTRLLTLTHNKLSLAALCGVIRAQALQSGIALRECKLDLFMRLDASAVTALVSWYICPCATRTPSCRSQSRGNAWAVR